MVLREVATNSACSSLRGISDWLKAGAGRGMFWTTWRSVTFGAGFMGGGDATGDVARVQPGIRRNGVLFWLLQGEEATRFGP